MKQIIPFQKELLFKTKVSEITSISLEHTLTLKDEDTVSGEFYISGDYKMTEGSINREKFDFHLPFDITLPDRYNSSTLVIDIDNFYYEVVNNESLKVNIDVYIEGEKKEPEKVEEEIEKPKTEESSIETHVEGKKQEETREISLPKIEIEAEEIEESINYQKPEKYYLEETNEKDSSDNQQFNLFENIDDVDNTDNGDTYVTYYVYIVKENDTIEKIMEKYNVTKENLELYNKIEEVKPGTKLIIPSTNE